MLEYLKKLINVQIVIQRDRAECSMAENEEPKKPKGSSKDLIDGTENMENDQDPGQSKLDARGLPSEGIKDGGAHVSAPENVDPSTAETERILESSDRPASTRKTVLPISGQGPDKRDEFSPTEVLDTSENQPRSPLDDTPPPPLGSTPLTPPPALDSRGMPLPRRMDEVSSANRTKPPAGYRTRGGTQRTRTQPVQQRSKLMNWWERKGPGGWQRGQGVGCTA